jgi:hypothetical protein
LRYGKPANGMWHVEWAHAHARARFECPFALWLCVWWILGFSGVDGGEVLGLGASVLGGTAVAVAVAGPSYSGSGSW